MPAKRHGTSHGYTLMVPPSSTPHIVPPLIRHSGWGKKLSYCIAFSADGAMDVTRRYVRDAKHAAERNRAPEAVLLHIMDEIRVTRRNNMSKQDKFRLQGEDIREDRELRGNVISSIAHAVSRLRPEDIINAQVTRRVDPDAQKALEGRMSGNQQWIRARGESGQGQQNQQDPRNQHPR
jgi:peptide-N4-(N-acetyl-beta-glucosaminyl)asparagine amidase